MGWFVSRGILLGVFLLAGEGINMARVAVVDWLAYRQPIAILFGILGIALTVTSIVFLAGFVRSRDTKRNRIPLKKSPN